MTVCESTTATLEQSVLQQSEQALRDKIEDLENQSRRNNLRFVGIPESLIGPALITFLSADLPKALGLDSPPDPQSIERAYRLGPQENTRRGKCET